jgi:ATP-dependent protease ClpP protease subunit
MDSAIRFYDFIKALNLKINTVGYGQVESAAIMLFLCGQKRFVHKDCRLRLHAPRYSGPEQLQVISVHQEVTTLLQKLDERYFEIIAKETSKKNSEIRKVYNKGKILVGKEAVDFGFATETVNKLPIFK